MSYRRKLLISLAGALTLAAAALAQPPDHREGPHPEGRGGPHGEARSAEPHEGPRGYERPREPQGWNNRPHDFDRGAYQHNFQAARRYHIGPYHRPPGWRDHQWVYGEVLPRAYWAPEYHISDYWLFALEVPPTGYEWVRDGDDALLVSIGNGEILQVEYGVFG